MLLVSEENLDHVVKKKKKSKNKKKDADPELNGEGAVGELDYCKLLIYSKIVVLENSWDG